jgi:hypothetical protein
VRTKAFFRLWLPLGLCATGVVLLAVEHGGVFGVSAFAAFFGAGSSIWLTNFLWRIGIAGNAERDQEEDARSFREQHGHWPDESGRTDA